MEKKYHVYALGNALVDTEVEVTDEFLTRLDLRWLSCWPLPRA